MADTGVEPSASRHLSKTCFCLPAEDRQRSPRICGRRRSRARDPPPAPDPGWFHLLLLALEEQERLEGGRGVHPSVAATFKTAAAATTASRTLPSDHFRVSGCFRITPALPNPCEDRLVAPYRSGGSCTGVRKACQRGGWWLCACVSPEAPPRSPAGPGALWRWVGTLRGSLSVLRYPRLS